MTDKPTHGGPRPASGRKPGYHKPGGLRETVCLKLTPELRATAARLGNGNISAGIRRALESSAALPA